MGLPHTRLSPRVVQAGVVLAARCVEEGKDSLLVVFPGLDDIYSSASSTARASASSIRCAAATCASAASAANAAARSSASVSKLI